MTTERTLEIMDFLSMITRVPNHLEVHHGTLKRCRLIVSIEVLISNSGLDD